MHAHCDRRSARWAGVAKTVFLLAYRRLKRTWVGKQLVKLEKMRLVERRERPGRRPELIVLRDDGSGDPFDDPDGTPGNSYLTVLRGVIASGALAEWKAPELAAYLAAMIAERYERDRRRRLGLDTGPGRWGRVVPSPFLVLRFLDAQPHRRHGALLPVDP